MMKIGITGGIGSGKSTVCRLFAQCGAPVYDSDIEARRLMHGPLRECIEARFGEASYRNGQLDRAYLAGRVFGDAAALADLNAIVHPAVKADFLAWCDRQQAPYVVLESAILFESGIDVLVDKTLAVLAPEQARIERVCRRDGTSPEQARKRIAAQMSDDELYNRADYTLVNLFEEDLEPAVTQFDRLFKREANGG